jgi:hypothetical protein
MSHFRQATVVMAALVAIIGLGGAAATAATTAPRHAKSAGADLGEAGVCANCKPPLTYSNGSVMGTASPAGTITVTPIYWTPQGYSFDAADSTYRSLINKYITDIVAASGTKGNVYGTLPEYSSTAAGVTTNIKYNIAGGTPLVDTDAFPATGQCASTVPPVVSPPITYTACITDAQTQAELKAYATANSLPADLSHLYVMFFPPNAQTQLVSGSNTYYSMAQFAGYHGHVTYGSNNLIYANMPFDPGFATSTPSGDPSADSAINTLSHELSEAITDPLNKGGWGDTTGNEIGDECANAYGPPIGSASTAYGPQPYNQVINGDFYYTQDEFSNAAYAATGIGTGCRQSAYGSGGNVALRGHQQHAKPAAAGATSMVTVDASPSSLPADGSSTSTITVTAVDSGGDPVAGDSMDLSTRDDNATPGACGTLSTGYGPGDTLVTDAAGQVTATYTASTASTDCYILATDTTVGTTDQTIVYQGTDSATAPNVAQTLPATLTSGGAEATFTATATNRSSTDIPDARLDLYLTGDDNGANGLDASQLTLSYKDGATNGDFVNVPLTGSTANGGVIDGFVIPDTAEALPAGATRTATFKLTLTAGAADSTVTGAPLQIETDLDQFDPADGSQSNLDRSAPGAVTVDKVAGDTVTYSGKLTTTSAPSGNTPGTAVLVAKTCTFASDGAACRLTGTETFTSSGGTLNGTITTDAAAGVADRVVTFTETFTTSSPTAGTGTGTAQLTYLDNGNTSPDTLAAEYTTKPDKSSPSIQADQGTITLTNSAP